MSSAAAPLLHVAPRCSPAPVNVLFIIDQLCQLGGAEKVLIRMAQHLPRERYSPRVLTFKIDPSLGFADALSCPLHVLPLQRTYDGHALRVAWQIREMVRRERIEIVHTFHETSDLWAGPIARWSGCPVLISSRRDMGFNRAPKHRWAYRWLGRHCFDQVQTVSEQVRQKHLQEDRLRPEQTMTVYNGIDLPPRPALLDRLALRRELGLAQATHVISTVGHLRSVKGCDIFVQTAARVCREFPGAVFALAGADHEPSYTAQLKQTVDALGLHDRILFLGSLDDPTALLRASDVFCLLSRSEGLSNALLEAMACELPCVATAVGGNPEVVVEGETGFLVGSEDAASAAVRVLQLLGDPELARRLGRQGRQLVEQKFTTDTMMKRLMNSYDQLLCNARHRRS